MLPMIQAQRRNQFGGNMDDARDTCPVCGAQLEGVPEPSAIDPRIIPIATALGMKPAEYVAQRRGAIDYERSLEKHMEEHSKAELLAELMMTRKLLFNVLQRSVS